MKSSWWCGRSSLVRGSTMLFLKLSNQGSRSSSFGKTRNSYCTNVSMSLIARNSSDFRANFSLSRSRMLTARRKIFENGGLCDVSRLPSLVDTPAPTIAYQPFLKRGAATKRVLVQCEEPFASADGVAHLADQVRCRIGRWRRPILCGVNRLSLRSGAPSVAITLFIVGLRLRLQLTSPRFIAARIALTSSLGFLFRAAFPAAPLRLMEARVGAAENFEQPSHLGGGWGTGGEVNGLLDE